MNPILRNPRAFIVPVSLAIVSTLLGGCKKKATEEVLLHEFSNAAVPETIAPPASSRKSATAPKEVPPPDAFVIHESDYPLIREFRTRHGISDTGYPSNVMRDKQLFNLGTNGTGYLTASTLSVRLPDKNDEFGYTTINLDVEAIKQLRGFIAKYREWCEVSKQQSLPHDVWKEIGKLPEQKRYIVDVDTDSIICSDKFSFITPDTLAIHSGNDISARSIRLRPTEVEQLENAITDNLPSMRALALERIEAAESQIAAEDLRRELLKAQIKSKKDAVDAALK